MSQSLIPTTTNTELAHVDATVLTSYLDALGLAAKLNQNEKEQFLQIAQAYQLNPFKREIYCTKYGDGQYAQFSIIVGYEVYLKRAERTGKLDGWEVEFLGDGDDMSCIVTIFRKDWTRPLKHQAWYAESVQKTKDGRPTKFWEKRRQMTRKVAISQAFRMAFPDELGGMPYTDDEMGVQIQETTAEVMQDAPKRQPYEHPVAFEARVPEADQRNAPQPRMSKNELADAAAALTQWQNDFDTIEVTPEAYLAHGKKLQGLKGLQPNDMVTQFKALCNVAAKRGIDYSKEQKTFYWNPDAAPVEVAQVEVVE